MTLDEAVEEKNKEDKGACLKAEKNSYHNTYMIMEQLKLIEQIHYVVKHDTLKQPETLKLLELRDRIINSL